MINIFKFYVPVHYPPVLNAVTGFLKNQKNPAGTGGIGNNNRLPLKLELGRKI